MNTKTTERGDEGDVCGNHGFAQIVAGDIGDESAVGWVLGA